MLVWQCALSRVATKGPGASGGHQYRLMFTVCRQYRYYNCIAGTTGATGACTNCQWGAKKSPAACADWSTATALLRTPFLP